MAPRPQRRSPWILGANDRRFVGRAGHESGVDAFDRDEFPEESNCCIANLSHSFTFGLALLW